ncbi:uncharacterized protein LOC108674162, partial [Hyalella azteca]|uniref:Uncharacterized protein LOC108674162 n=1 Tax=Hyalella azteca TaxID=294128 RepID=A0A8B7NXF0_HYAAZ
MSAFWQLVLAVACVSNLTLGSNVIHNRSEKNKFNDQTSHWEINYDKNVPYSPTGDNTELLYSALPKKARLASYKHSLKTATPSKQWPLAPPNRLNFSTDSSHVVHFESDFSSQINDDSSGFFNVSYFGNTSLAIAPLNKLRHDTSNYDASEAARHRQLLRHTLEGLSSLMLKLNIIGKCSVFTVDEVKNSTTEIIDHIFVKRTENDINSSNNIWKTRKHPVRRALSRLVTANWNEMESCDHSITILSMREQYEAIINKLDDDLKAFFFKQIHPLFQYMESGGYTNFEKLMPIAHFICEKTLSLKDSEAEQCEEDFLSLTTKVLGENFNSDFFQDQSKRFKRFVDYVEDPGDALERSSYSGYEDPGKLLEISSYSGYEDPGKALERSSYSGYEDPGKALERSSYSGYEEKSNNGYEEPSPSYILVPDDEYDYAYPFLVKFLAAA